MSINLITAQFKINNPIYISGEFNIGNYVGGDISLNYISKKNYVFKIGYSGNLRKPKSIPEDYALGFSEFLTLFLLARPYDQLENYYAGTGKVYNLNRNGTIRLNITFGLGYTIIREPINWMRIDNAFLTSNYTWEYYKYNTVSLIINPKIEFAFSRFYGLTLSPMIQINKDRTYFGVGIGNMIGLLRKKRY
ncbi:hypothetical protein [Gaetbulibacter aestuarii]|uniref:DUF3575 domain-containing protein n=1 Tax=Gaetbulibacter aestuarii TaxID=1502358 RepID=A0ABW7N0Q4_9FLAO